MVPSGSPSVRSGDAGRVARSVAQGVPAVPDPDHGHGGVIRVGPGRGGRDPPVIAQQVLGLDVHPPGAGPDGLPQAAPVHHPLQLLRHPPGDLVLEGGPVLAVEGEQVVSVPGQEQVQHVVELRPQALVVLEDLGRPGSADATRVITLSPELARPGALPRSRWLSTSSPKPRCRAKVAGRSSPALATRRWSSKMMRIRSGLFCASILYPDFGHFRRLT